MSNLSSSVDNVLTISSEEEGQNDLRFTIKALSKNFCAQGSAYFGRKYLLEEIAKFKNFPLRKECPPTICGGVFRENDPSKLEKHLHISVEPLDSVGNLVMRVELYEPCIANNNINIGRGGSCDYVLSYDELDEFIQCMESVVSGKINYMTFSKFVDCPTEFS